MAGKIHFAVSVLGLAASVAAPFFLARAFKIQLKTKMAAKVLFGVGLLFSALVVIGIVMAMFALPGVGFAQRIFYYTYFILILALAAKILHNPLGFARAFF